ncbi:MAG: DinB family protein [Anaerolineae bacterium]|nr:DinB family protein [Anaerolineae bacterium]MCO5190060.1 DinB family protein [Anaerolineae bacterium]MCO5194508.1 DinB family protein [Anaerolineae bacterium]MCO5196684.1 DinB family protein [Anaerolineae bacterium]
MMTERDRAALIEEMRNFPDRLELLVAGLSAEQLTTAVIDGEWTIAQNVHHVVDSHMNSYVRCKLMATEDNPPLKPYDEVAWSRFVDAKSADLTATFQLLHGLHARWVIFWENLPDAAWSRTGDHLASGSVTLAEQLQLYVDHGNAHLDQIRRTLRAMNR